MLSLWVPFGCKHAFHSPAFACILCRTWTPWSRAAPFHANHSDISFWFSQDTSNFNIMKLFKIRNLKTCDLRKCRAPDDIVGCKCADHTIGASGRCLRKFLLPRYMVLLESGKNDGKYTFSGGFYLIRVLHSFHMDNFWLGTGTPHHCRDQRDKLSHKCASHTQREFRTPEMKHYFRYYVQWLYGLVSHSGTSICDRSSSPSWILAGTHMAEGFCYCMADTVPADGIPVYTCACHTPGVPCTENRVPKNQQTSNEVNIFQGLPAVGISTAYQYISSIVEWTCHTGMRPVLAVHMADMDPDDTATCSHVHTLVATVFRISRRRSGAPRRAEPGGSLPCRRSSCTAWACPPVGNPVYTVGSTSAVTSGALGEQTRPGDCSAPGHFAAPRPLPSSASCCHWPSVGCS